MSALVIESLYGMVFVMLYHFIIRGEPTLLSSTLWLVYYTLLFIVLGVMALYDRAHSYVPAAFLYAYGFLSLMMLAVRYMDERVFQILLDPVIVSLPFLLIFLITRGRGLGFADVLLFLGVGAFFGVPEGMAVLFISVWSGALYGLYLKYAHPKKDKKYIAMPFVPFIIFGFLVVLFTEIDVFSIASLFA